MPKIKILFQYMRNWYGEGQYILKLKTVIDQQRNIISAVELRLEKVIFKAQGEK